MKKFSVVGKRIPKTDAPDKVTGRATYGQDFKLPGMLHGAIRYSDHAHARILSIDTSKAEALEGVKCVVTAADVPETRFHAAKKRCSSKSPGRNRRSGCLKRNDCKASGKTD